MEQTITCGCGKKLTLDEAFFDEKEENLYCEDCFAAREENSKYENNFHIAIGCFALSLMFAGLVIYLIFKK